MDIVWSRFAERLGTQSGINELMEDLGDALANGGSELSMMGGGNPARIPEIEEVWRRRLVEICQHPDTLEAMLGRYDVPQGNLQFLSTIAEYFRDTFGWPITEKNIVVTAGSQTGAFLLFNAICDDNKKIGFPLVPEYIGYANQLTAGGFVANRPQVELRGDHRFKYHVDFDALDTGDGLAALVVSRPTNPSTNVLSTDELQQLVDRTRDSGTLLYIDNAYGQPMPGVIFGNQQLPQWEPHSVYGFSLSKLGLPNTRTGILVASEDIVSRLARINAVVGLSTGSIGQAIMEPILRSREIDRLVENHIRPFYRARAAHALSCLDDALAGVNYRVHEPEGAFFLWLWLPELSIDSRELYERLKARGVIVVSGHYFFAGLDEPWTHQDQCVRISYCQPPEVIERGMRILAEEIRLAR